MASNFTMEDFYKIREELSEEYAKVPEDKRDAYWKQCSMEISAHIEKIMPGFTSKLERVVKGSRVCYIHHKE